MTISSGTAQLNIAFVCPYCCLPDGSFLTNLSRGDCDERGGVCSPRSDCVKHEIGLCCYGPIDANGEINQNFQVSVDGLTKQECDRRAAKLGGLFFKTKTDFRKGENSQSQPCAKRRTTTTTIGPNSCSEIDGFFQCDDNLSACEWQYIQTGFETAWQLIPNSSRKRSRQFTTLDLQIHISVVNNHKFTWGIIIKK